jgi:hypothetical protein
MSSIFTEKSKMPDARALAGVLGVSYNYWEEIDGSIRKSHGATRQEWKFYGAKSGWQLKLLLKKRNLFFMVPYEKHFLIVFLFGDKAVEAVEKSDLPPAMIQELKDARRYMEGRGLRVDVRTRAAVKHVLTLVEIKINN